MSGIEQLAALLPSPGEARKVISTYARARASDTTPWQYTLVPFSAGTATPAPVYFEAPSGSSVSGQHTVSADVSLDGSWLVVKLTLKLDATAVASYEKPRVEVVLCPERSVLPDAAAERLSVIVLSLGLAANGSALDPPAEFTVTAKIPTSPDGRLSPAQAMIDNPGGAPAVVWIADGPVTSRKAYLGTTAGLDKLDATLLNSLTSLLGVNLITLTNKLARLEVDGVLTVDTDAPVTGTRVAITFPAPDVKLAAQVTTPWVPSARPAVRVTGGSGSSRRWRYSVAARRNDGTLSPPGAASAVVTADTGASVSVESPPSPGFSHFTEWVLYRARLAPGGWTTPEAVVDMAAGVTISDVLPDPNTAVPGEPGDPGFLQITWGDKAQLAPPSPAGMKLLARTDSYDEVLPGQRMQTLEATVAELPPNGLAKLRPTRGNLEGMHFRWDAGATAVEVKTSTQLSSAGMTIFGGLPEQATFALHPTTGLAALAPPLSDSAPFSRVFAGWRASAMASLHARVVAVPEIGPTSAMAVVLEGLPTDLALELVLPRDRIPGESAAIHDARKYAPIRAVVGKWQGAPVAGESPTVALEVEPTATDTIGRLLVRFGPPEKTNLPVAGPGPELTVDIGLPPAGQTAFAAVDVAGLRRLDLRRAPGYVERFAARLEMAQPCAARIRLTIPDESGDRTSINTRVGRLAATTELDISMLTVEPGQLADASDPQQRPGELHVEVPAVEGATGPLLEQVRVFIDTVTASSAMVMEIDALRPGARIDLLPVPSVVDVAGNDRYAWKSPPTGPGVGARIAATLPGGALLRLAAQEGARGSASDTRRKPLDVVAGVPETVTLRFGGDLGTLGQGTDATRIVDAEASFSDDWAGRPVFWRGGRGSVVTGGSATELAITVESGTPPDPTPPPLLAWYRIGDRARGEAGARLVADGPVRARVAIVADDRAEHRTRLRAPTAGPKVRLEQLDDLDPAVAVDDRGKVAAIAARIAVNSFAMSGWGIPDAEARTRLPLTRVLGSMRMPERADVLEEIPELHGWSRLDIGLDPNRPNRSISVIARSRRTTTDRGRDTSNLRLSGTPDHIIALLGPGVVELESTGEFLPAPPSADHAIGEMIAEPSVWFRVAEVVEAAYTRAQLRQIPPRLVLVSGWRNPELVNELESSDLANPIRYGPIDAKRWKLDATRILASGTLRLGRMSSVRWDSAMDVDAGDVGSTDLGVIWGRDVLYSLSDIWHLTLTPHGSEPVEAILHSMGEAFEGGGSNFQATVSGGELTTRIFKVKLGDRKMAARRRARLEVGGWPTELAVEIQISPVEGSFAVGPQVGIDWDPFRYLQDDETSDDSWWWMAAYETPFGSAQFGSHGFTGMYDAPWDPYWS
ncbi:hypothetical protein [Sphingomonas sp.]|uniref:hypothetical protein n=1 Tax=Sphingomonas sp. TaxID=28214 RepID=UPI0017F9AF7B|nr:hypothetical protein [Sphingomonas sp.]MBA3512316.1 hypothetical protein [Sphingomonas sp.]